MLGAMPARPVSVARRAVRSTAALVLLVTLYYLVPLGPAPRPR
jgi:hypothetical protein